MRARLLEATVECLVEYGYAGTTTAQVAARAGVTRGALIHHFQSKAHLLAESVRHLAVKRTWDVLDELAGDDLSSGSTEWFLDVLWRIHQGPMADATLELLVAARTHPDLREHVDQFETMVLRNLSTLGVFDGTTADVADRADAANSLGVRGEIGLLAVDVIQGILFSSLTATQESRERRWAQAKQTLELRFGALLPDQQVAMAKR